MFDAFVCFICCLCVTCLLFCALPCNCTVVLIVWTIGQVLVLSAAFLCLSDLLMMLLYTASCVTVPVAEINNDDDDDDAQSLHYTACHCAVQRGNGAEGVGHENLPYVSIGNLASSDKPT